MYFKLQAVTQNKDIFLQTVGIIVFVLSEGQVIRKTMFLTWSICLFNLKFEMGCFKEMIKDLQQ